jgi:hypothetical protein
VRREYQVYFGRPTSGNGGRGRLGGGFFKSSFEGWVLSVIGYITWKVMGI